MDLVEIRYHSNERLYAEPNSGLSIRSNNTANCVIVRALLYRAGDAGSRRILRFEATPLTGDGQPEPGFRKDTKPKGFAT